MAQLIDYSGQRFGRLVAIEFAERRKSRIFWRFKCDCGTVKEIFLWSVRAGEIQSCGCLHKEKSAESCRKRLTKHGLTAGGNQRIYRIWTNMISRCTRPSFDSYKYYGGRGISVCKEWADSFSAFLTDMGVPEPNLTLDRIDVNGNYEPSNCRWVTWDVQCKNKRPKAKK